MISCWKHLVSKVAAAIAGLLAIATPQAAIDDAGMQYTSAAEGFYGSLRLDLSQYDASGSVSTETTGVTQRDSRLGVRGSVDLGRGMSATYQYEFNVYGNNGSPVGETRLHNVGLEGPFGSLLLGTQWSVDYNYVWGKTDIMNYKSGNLLSETSFPGRESNVVTYASPDFNGFDFAVGLRLDPNPTETNCVVYVPATTPPFFAAESSCATAIEQGINVNPKANSEAEAIDRFSLGIGYSAKGWDVGGVYSIRNNPVGIALVNLHPGITFWDSGLYHFDDDTEEKVHGFSLGYARNNWKLNYFYGSSRTNLIPGGSSIGNNVHSLAGQIEIKKVTLRALRETGKIELDFRNQANTVEQAYNTIGAQYDLGIKSRIYFEYYSDELDDSGDILNSGGDQDVRGWSLGYRVDF